MERTYFIPIETKYGASLTVSLNLMTSAQDEVPETKEIEFLEEVMQYQNLKKLLSRKLNRVL